MWGAMWGAPMILKVGCTQVLGPLRDTNLAECLALRVLGPNVPTWPKPQAFRLRDQLLAKRLPGRLAARSLGVVKSRRVQRLGADDHSVAGRPHDDGRRADSCMLFAWHRKHRRTGPASYKGQFAPVRTFVLPSLPTRRSTRSCRTHNQSSRISLRAPCRVFEAANAHMVQPLTSDP